MDLDPPLRIENLAGELVAAADGRYAPSEIYFLSKDTLRTPIAPHTIEDLAAILIWMAREQSKYDARLRRVLGKRYDLICGSVAATEDPSVFGVRNPRYANNEMGLARKSIVEAELHRWELLLKLQYVLRALLDDVLRRDTGGS